METSRAPKSLADLTGLAGEFRAGGTDLQERRRSGVATGPIVDITRLPGLDRIEWNDSGAATIGALVRIDAVARDGRITGAYPGLAGPTETLATPQIRAMATMGGVLLQRTRCAYYRHPAFECFKSGGEGCPAREGDIHYGVCFDLGPCVYPHPSSVAVALLAYEAHVYVLGRGDLTITDLYGDGSDPTADHLLQSHELLRSIRMPPPVKGERAAYVRLMSREWAEWPLIECVARLVVDKDVIRLARVAAGAVANVPLRLTHVERALEGRPPTAATLEAAAELATEGSAPLPQTVYKLPMLRGTALDALEKALG